MSGALAYLDEQIEAIRTRLPAALHDFDSAAIHQSRVGTRRLKAGFDVLAPLLADLNADGLGKAGKMLRRRLGPLRDLDVMIAALGQAGLPAKSAAAAEWIVARLEADRTDARAASMLPPKKAIKLISRFDDWWRVRHGLESLADGVTPLLTAALHERFDAFAGLADRVAGLTAETDDLPPIDLHELRIDGKAVRYAFEIAAAHGLPIPKKVAKTFKAMQDALGDWHDAVVLADAILKATLDADLPLHRQGLASAVLDVARVYLQRSERALATFVTLWKRGGVGLRTTLAERVPLISETSASRVEVTDDTPTSVANESVDSGGPTGGTTERVVR